MENKYDGWLVSTSLVKRSLAVVGHYFVGQLLISIPFLIIFALVLLSIGD